VLEGFISAAGYTESEGPFGEFLGYYGGVKSNPVFHCTAITRRADALFQTVTISGRSMANTDTGQLMALRTEALAWRSLEAAIREPLAVHATAASGGMFTLRISMRQHAVGEARNAIAAAFASVANVKNVFVVDPDIDIFSDQEMDWALATRFQADRDLVVEGGFRTPPLDPSLHGGLAGAKAGFDLTWPYGMAERLERHVPAPPGPLDLPRHDDVESALCDGPKTFAEVMACTGSRDGREIVRAIDGLRRAGRLGRGEAGRWAILPVSG